MLLESFFMVAGSLLMVATAPGIIELAFLTLGGIMPMRLSDTRSPADFPPLHFCVVVPAHDEGSGIAACVGSLLRCETAQHQLSIVVIADNCTDDTAQHAQAAGARVIVRHDTLHRGKGQALSFAFDKLLRENHDVFVVVDADTRVKPNLIQAMAPLFAAGADAVQCRYLASNPEASLRTRLMHVAWLAYNILRLRGREFWGCSVGILGNGFALSRKALQALPFEADSIAEDLDYQIRFVESGRRVRFCNGTTVLAPAPSTGSVASAQRARWEGGRLRMMRERLPSLLAGVARGQLRLIEPAFDLMLLPLAFQVLLLIALVLLPWGPTRFMGLLGLAVVGMHIAAALVIGRAGWRDWLALAGAPFYILWKLTLGKRLFAAAAKDAAWVRTERTDTDE
ncbi:MAG: glycosyltransferase family 2 protein [Methylococcaceae bacterium]|nr:glycosyltransferase family 2 protein [Methylococcaceae bacterium]